MNTPQGGSNRQMEESILNTLNLFHGDSVGPVELRIFGTGKGTISGYYDNEHFGDAAKAAAFWTGKAEAVYFTLNPIPEDLIARAYNQVKAFAKHTTKDEHVLHRRWLLIDCDAKRTEGTSATDEEKAAAIARAAEVAAYLADRGWPAPIEADSGNGGHRVYRIDQPNNDASAKLISNCLRALAQRFDDDVVGVDVGTFNASRVCTLYGTWKRKGDNVPAVGRVHRPSVLLQAPPAPIGVVSLDLLQELAEEYRPAAPAAPTRSAATSGTPGGASLTDSDLLDRAFKATNGDKFRRLWSGDSSDYGGDDSRGDAALLQMLAYWTGKDPARMQSLFEQSQRVRDKWNEREDYRERSIDSAIARCGEVFEGGSTPVRVGKNSGSRRNGTSPGGAGHTDKSDAKPRPGNPNPDSDAPKVAQIVTTNRPDEEIAAESWVALLKANTPPVLFARGLGLARLVYDANTSLPVVEGVDVEAMLYHMRRSAHYYSARRKKGEDGADDEIIYTHVPAPARIAKDMLKGALSVGDDADTEEIAKKTRLPTLRTIIYAPVMAPNGSLLTKPGYHPAIQMYLATKDLGDVRPAARTQAAARAAWERLFTGDGPYSQFPYVDKSAIAHATALLLTPFLRPYIGGLAPAFLFDAPESHTGKSLLARNLLGVSDPFLHVADTPAARSGEEAEAEWSKMLASALKDGGASLFLDNVRGVLRSTALESMLTSRKPWSGRLVGTGQMVTVWPELLTIVVTANNLQTNIDMSNRMVRARLDAKVENPALRTGFKIKDLDAYVEKNRREIVADVLTMLAAWSAAGRPEDPEASKGNYNRWAACMGGLLNFLGVPGFLADAEDQVATLDPEKARWTAFTALWHERYGTAKMQAKDLIEEAAAAEVIVSAADHGASRSLGKYLQAQRDRIYGGLRIVAVRGAGGILRYSVRSTDDEDGLFASESSSGFSDNSGFAPSATHDPFLDSGDGSNKGSRNEPEATHLTPLTHSDENEREAFKL